MAWPFPVAFSTAVYSSLQFFAALYSYLQFSTVLYSSLQFSTARYNCLQFPTVLYISLHFSTLLYSSRLYCKNFLKIVSNSWNIPGDRVVTPSEFFDVYILDFQEGTPPEPLQQ